jgi:hypothetical protein
MELDEQIAVWLAQLLSNEPPAKSIIAFNVGLFETTDGYCAYLSGATKYDAESDDWALEEAYSPSQREFPLPNVIFPFPKWEDALEQFGRALKTALARPELRHSPLLNAEAIAFGFDDGDLQRVT